MPSTNLRKQLPLLLALAIAASCWLGARTLNDRALDARASWPDTEEYVWLPAPEVAPVLAMGYRQLWADITWARALVYYGASRKQGTNYRYLTQFIDNILALDPKFKRVYRWAAYAVLFQDGTVKPEEHHLSVRYLERGIQEFPDGYELFWIAGIRYFLDLQSDDPAEERRFRERGAELIELAMHKPDAPRTLASLAARLRTQLGQHQRALDDLRQVILTTDDEEARKQLIIRYNQLAGASFPEEEKRAMEEFRNRWMAELPFAPPSMYVLLGDRPAPVIDFDRLATERDLFGAESSLPAPAAPEPAEAPAGDATGASGETAGDASAQPAP